MHDSVLTRPKITPIPSDGTVVGGPCKLGIIMDFIVMPCILIGFAALLCFGFFLAFCMVVAGPSPFKLIGVLFIATMLFTFGFVLIDIVCREWIQTVHLYFPKSEVAQ